MVGNFLETGRGIKSVLARDSSTRPGDPMPYSYDGVANQELMTFLDRFERRLQERIREDKTPEEDWRIQLSEAVRHFSTVLGGKNKTDNLIYYVRAFQVIELISEERGNKPLYFLNADMCRAVAALSWQSDNYQGSKKGQREAMVESARKALGEHSLADLIRKPVSPKSKITNSEEERFIAPVELDYLGAFWKTPLGEAVKGFAEAQNEIGFLFSMTTADVAEILKLRLELRGGGTDDVSDLVRSGLLIGVEKGSNGGNRFRFEHVFLAGLIFIYIEKGYSKAEAIKNLRSMLEGTTLIHYLGEEKNLTNTSIIHRKIFAETSPWRNFPLEPKRSGGKPSKVWRET